MSIGKYAEAARTSLKFCLRAWCLTVEQGAAGISKGDIELAIRFLDTDGRLLDKWKAGQIPTVYELGEANSNAIKQGWMPEKLGSALLRAFEIHRSPEPVGSREGWDEMAAFKAFQLFTAKSPSPRLQEHCSEWENWICGPSEESADFDEWLRRKRATWDLTNQELLEDEVSFLVERLLVQIYENGVADPREIVMKKLKSVSKNWSKIVDELRQDVKYTDISGTASSGKRKVKARRTPTHHP